MTPNAHTQPSLPRRPFTLQVEVTSRCNLKCKMCPLTLGTTPSGAAPGDMAEATWDRVRDLASRVGFVVLAGFGEPTLNPNFLSALRDLDDRGVATSFATNGIAIRPEFVAELAGLRQLAQVNVSIDSPDPVIYQQIRGGNVNRALRGLRLLREGLPAEIVQAASVVMDSTAESLLAFPRLLSDLGVRTYVLQGMHDRAVALGPEHPGERGDRRIDFVQAIKAVGREHGVDVVFVPSAERLTLEFTDPGEARLVYRGRDGVSAGHTRRCFNPWKTPYIDKDGLVYPCCLADRTAVMGDLKAESFDAIWEGEPYRKFRQDLLDGGEALPPICRTCSVFPVGPHPLNEYAAELIPEQSRFHGRLNLVVVARNTGRREWTRERPVEIGVWGDRASRHHHPGWLAPHRVCRTVEDVVPPGGCGTFRFAAIPAAGDEPEVFQLVCRGAAHENPWLGDAWLLGTEFGIDPRIAGLADAARAAWGVCRACARGGRRAVVLVRQWGVTETVRRVRRRGLVKTVRWLLGGGDGR